MGTVKSIKEDIFKLRFLFNVGSLRLGCSMDGLGVPVELKNVPTKKVSV
jgi:hypothetical protein